MMILVTDPTGPIGSRIIPELLAPEFTVRVLACDPDRLPAETREQIEVVRGSVADPDTLRRALAGVEALFWCVPADSLPGPGDDASREIMATGASRSIRESGTSRVVSISSWGLDGSAAGRFGMEEILDRSGASVRHLRCGILMENLLWQADAIRESGVLALPVPASRGIPLAAADDVADAALRWLVRRDWTGSGIVHVRAGEILCGDRIAGVIESVLDRPVGCREMSGEEFCWSMIESGMAPAQARHLAALLAELADEDPVPGSFRGIAAPTTLAAWAVANLAGPDPELNPGGRAHAPGDSSCATVCHA